MSNYDNLDYRLNILYDYVYNENNNICYKFKPISISEISLDKIKMNNKTLEKDIFSEEIKFIGTTNNKYHFKRLSKTNYPCTITVGIYKDKNDINNMKSPENVNILNTYVLSELIANDGNKFVILPIGNFDLTFSELSNYSSVIANEIKKNNKVTNDTVLFINITEHYFSMDTLLKFLIENSKKMTLKHWKSLFFQILFMLHKITHRLKQFRHNKLDLESIWVYKRKDTESMKEFIVNDVKFEVPIYNFEIKIMDFENSTSLDIPNIKKKNENPYYDIHYFFQNIIFIYNEIENIPNEIKKFIDEIIPEIFHYKNKSSFTGLDENLYEKESSIILNSSLILKKNNFFTEFIKENMDMSISPMSDSIKNINQYNIKENGINYSVSASDHSDAPRMLAKKNKSISGSRKIKSRKSSKKSSKKSNKKSNSILDNAEKRVARSTKSDDSDVYSGYKSSSHSASRAQMREENEESQSELNRMKKKIMKKHSRKSSRTGSMRSNSEDSDDLPDMSLVSDDTIKEDQLNALSRLLNKAKKDKKSKRKHSESESSLSNSQSEVSVKNNQQENGIPQQLQNNILGNLPSNYSGVLPDHYQSQLASQGALNMNNPMMGAMGPASMMGPSPMPLSALSQMNGNVQTLNSGTKFNNNALASLGGQPQMSVGNGLPTNFNNSLGSASMAGMNMNNGLGSAGMNMNNGLGSAGMNMNNGLGSVGMNMSNFSMGSLNEQANTGITEQPQLQQSALPQQMGGARHKKYKLKNTNDFFF
jgi:hypothetical protein